MDKDNLVPKQKIFDFEGRSTKIVSISKNTVYDIPFKLRILAQSIEENELYATSDAIIFLRYSNKETGFPEISSHHYGTGERVDALGIIELGKKSILGS